MLNLHTRAFWSRLLLAPARGLARTGVSPDLITVIGTLGLVGGALIFYPQGRFFVGTLVITVFVFSDMVDGALARITGRASKWGAFLDSTLDRIGDAAIFAGLAWWFARGGDDAVMLALCLYCLISGAVVSYAKARAEGLGLTCNVGLAERAERLLLVLVTTGLDGLGLPYVQAVGLWVLAIASTITLGQRMATVYRQTLGGPAGTAG
ncbi:MAG: phosphatidylinositol phosphate synthase [Actinomycetes bacterium]